MMMAAINPGEKIAVPRNSHKSMLGGLIMSGAEPIYMQPEVDEALRMDHCVTPETVARTLQQHPDLAAIAFPDGMSGEEPVRAWLDGQVALHGETRPVARLAPEDHTAIDPVTEFAIVAPHAEVIPVVIADGPESGRRS